MRIAWQRLLNRSGHEAGLALLEQLYREETGKPLPSIAKTPQGKPYFPQSDLHFSISHTPNHAFCCLHSENVGIDAEEIGRAPDMRLLDRYCSPNERQRITSANHPADALLRLWVLKESYAKFTGRGLGNYLKATDFSPDDPRIQIIDGCYVAVFTEERTQNHAL